MESYIPTTDVGALEWMENMGAKLVENPALFLVTPADAAGVQAAVTAFREAFDVTNQPETKRNPVLVAAKDDARTAAEQICRQFAIQIKHSAAISDPVKISIGVRPVNPNRDPIPLPVSSPVLSIFGAGTLTHTLRFEDALTGRKKPYGVRQLQLWINVADSVDTDPGKGTFHGLFTKSPTGIAYESEDAGKIANLSARWCTLTGGVGPWSAVAHMMIAA